MRKLKFNLAAAGVAGVLVSGLPPMPWIGSAAALELITEQEAALPPDATRDRGITRGPKIILVWPSPEAGFIHSPLQLKIRFQGFGGATIKPDSVVVTYRKLPPIDLTQRIRPFIDAYGIEVPDATVPSGPHRVRVDVEDTLGRKGRLDFTFNVRQ
jgi:hypothetical protein